MRRILEILFPPKCWLCGGRAESGSELCLECKDKFIRETFDKCPVCGETVSVCSCGAGFAKITKTVIGNRKSIALSFYVRGNNDRYTDRMIFMLKDRATFADFFADELARAVRTVFDGADVSLKDWTVTYPPRSVKRFIEKGFDQSEEISEKLARRLGIKCEKTFVRGGSGSVQKELDSKARHLNAEESLIPMKNHIKKGGKYIVLDDIITSGATIETMAKNLYFYGAEEVFPVSVARTMPKKKQKI